MTKDQTTPEDFFKCFAAQFLPENLLTYFDIVSFETEELPKDKQVDIYKKCLHVYVKERDNRQVYGSHLRSNGFTEETTVTDFPCHGMKVQIHAKRRRYLDDEGKSCVPCPYQFKVKGTSYTPEYGFFCEIN